MVRTSYSTGVAARLLGISIPTLKRKCAAGEIPYFLTAGGHRRIPSDAVAKLLGNETSSPARGPLSVPRLEGRREELEVAVPGMRKQSEAGGGSQPRSSQQTESRTPQPSAPELEIDADFEAGRLSSDPARWQSLEGPESKETRHQPGVFHRRWRNAAADLLPTWLSFEQHEKTLEALDRVIARCSEHDEPRMPQLLRGAIARLLAPWERERQVAMRRERLQQRAGWSLPTSASASERARATAAVREALANLPLTAFDHEERAAAQEAVRKMSEVVRARLAREEAQAKKANEEQRRGFEEEWRKQRKDVLVRRGVDKVWWRLLRLKNDRAISADEYHDIDQESLKRAVGRLLRSEITGDETDQDLEGLVEEIVMDELDLEPIQDEGDEED